jgi:phage gp29-like protein
MAKSAKKRVFPRAEIAHKELGVEVAGRLLDPFDSSFQGIIRSNDPLLLERGENLEIYRDLKRDGKVFTGLQKRIGTLISYPWTVTSSDEKSAEKMRVILGSFNFDQMCRDLMDALLMGISVSEFVPAVKDSLLVPGRVIKRRQRRFIYHQDSADQPPKLRLLTTENMLTGIALPDKRFIVHRVNPEDDNPYGTGLGLQLYWPVFFKRRGIVSWNKLCERFGSPTPWGKYPRNAGPKEKGTLFDALRALSNDGVVMTPEGMSIDLLESKLTGSITTQEALVKYMDDWIIEVILGQEPRVSGGGALAAASKEREGVRLDLVQADSDLLSETLNQSIISWLCEYNGLAPCQVWRSIKKDEDKKAASETDKNVSEMGFELSEEAVREKYGNGWSRKKEPKPANFSEPPTSFSDPGQGAVDAALEDISRDDLGRLMEGLIGGVLDELEGVDSYEEALAILESAFPKIDPNSLSAWLSNGMFNAELFGRVSNA